MLIIVVSVVVEGGNVSDSLKGDPSKRFSVLGSQVFEAIGVIRSVIDHDDSASRLLLSRVSCLVLLLSAITTLCSSMAVSTRQLLTDSAPLHMYPQPYLCSSVFYSDLLASLSLLIRPKEIFSTTSHP